MPLVTSLEDALMLGGGLGGLTVLLTIAFFTVGESALLFVAWPYVKQGGGGIVPPVNAADALPGNLLA